jgi:hypothetical protein
LVGNSLERKTERQNKIYKLWMLAGKLVRKETTANRQTDQQCTSKTWTHNGGLARRGVSEDTRGKESNLAQILWYKKFHILNLWATVFQYLSFNDRKFTTYFV